MMLTDTWPYQLTKPNFSDLGYLSGHALSKTKSVTPIFFAFLAISLHFCVAILKEKSVRGNFWAQTPLKMLILRELLRSLRPRSLHKIQGMRLTAISVSYDRQIILTRPFFLFCIAAACRK